MPLGVLALALLPLGGCNLGPDYVRPEVEMPVQFRATEATEAAAWPSEDWWRGFKSSELNVLIEQARTQNFDIAAAIARIQQADAQVRIAGAAMLPTANASGQCELAAFRQLIEPTLPHPDGRYAGHHDHQRRRRQQQFGWLAHDRHALLRSRSECRL